MRLKWDKREHGTILGDLFASNCGSDGGTIGLTKDTSGGSDGGGNPSSSQLNLISYPDDDLDEDEETRRLHPSDQSCGSGGGYFQETKSKLTIYKGIIYSFLSSFFFSLCSVMVKYLDNIHPGELAVFRFLGIFILTVPLVLYYGHNPLGPLEMRHFLILRGIAGSTNLFLRFYAIRYLPIGDASVIIFSVPVFVSIFASIFLKEPCGWFQSVAVALTMVGLCLTTKLPMLMVAQYVSPANSSLGAANHTDDLRAAAENRVTEGDLSMQRIYGILAAMTSTVFAATVYILIRKAKSVHHSVIMFNFGWVAILETTALTTLCNGFSLPQASSEWALIVVLGIFSFFGQILLTQSLQLEQAGPVSVVRSATDIALALVWQLWLFGDVPDAWSMTGAFLVTLCIILTSLRKWLLSLPEHSYLKRQLSWLTH